MTARLICAPLGWSQSSGTATVAHCRPACGGSQFPHAIAELPDPGRGLDAAAYGVLTDTATRPKTIAATAVRTRRRGLPLVMSLAITNPRRLERTATYTASPCPAEVALAQRLLTPIQAF